MKTAIETGLRLAEEGRGKLRTAAALKEALDRFDWFYCGAEFCENLLEGPAWHEEQAAFFLSKGARVCFLTPPLSEKGLKKLKAVFQRLAAYARREPRAARRLEVTVNDLGALQLAAETRLGLPLALGRVISSNALHADRLKLKVLNGEALRLFASLGARRFEVSTSGRLPATNFASAGAYGFRPGRFSLSLHYPYRNLTSGRSCVTGMPAVPPEESPAGIRCRRECGACSFQVGHPLVREKLLVRGNTVFMEFPKKFYRSAGALLKRRIDRLIYSPWP